MISFSLTRTMTTSESLNNNNLFTDENFPKIILNKIWSYLIDEAPLDDGLTLTCKTFRDITYQHPSHSSRFHFRLEPLFILNNFKTNHNKFQIGAPTTPATKRAIIVTSINDAIINNKNITFPFHQIKVFNIAQSCKLKDVLPFFDQFKDNIKFMSWNAPKFLNQDINKMDDDDDTKMDDSKKELIKYPLSECTLFSLLTRGRWHKSINLNGKFPKLLCFSYTIEWYDHFDLIQDFLDSHCDTISILFLDFNFKLPQNKKEEWEKEALDDNNKNPTRLKLKLPKNIEICALSCLFEETSKFIDIDFEQCRHKLKQIVCVRNSIRFCNPMFEDGKGNKTLKYLVINTIEDVDKIKWEKLKIGTNTINQLENIYLPCTPEFAHKISAKCIGETPDLESVKECIENGKVRKVLRDLNCEQRRHWLWGLFWFHRHGIGMKKLKILENQWKKQQDVEYF